MLISSTLGDAMDRIASRAQDALSAYGAGVTPLHNDVADNAAALLPASDPLSVVAPPSSYFLTGTADGAQRYTRNGAFRLEGGALVSTDGANVLGYAAGVARGGVPVPLRLDPRDVALGRASDVRMESDGSLAYTRTSIDPRTGERDVERVCAGTVALARFPAGTAPVRVDATHAGAPPGVVPHLGTPSDGAFAGLATYSRDPGAIDLNASLAKLSEAYLAFAALRTAQQARFGSMRTATDLVK
jgi:hypothetical protein